MSASQHRNNIDRYLTSLTAQRNPAEDDHVTVSACAVRIAFDGNIVYSRDAGFTAFENNNASQYGGSAPQPLTKDTRFDLASLTKCFVALALLFECENHDIPLDSPLTVAPENPCASIAQALSHTSGFPAIWDAAHNADSGILGLPLDERWERFRHIRPVNAPGTRFEYSDIGLIFAGMQAEHIAGRSLKELIQRDICEPWQLTHTSFGPLPHGLAAQTEFDTLWRHRILDGEVHDETSFALGGIVGNAGLFSTADDVLHFAEGLRLAREHDNNPMHRAALNLTTPIPHTLQGMAHGTALGTQIDDPEWMTDLAGRSAFGHTGYTGTCFMVDPDRRLSIVILTNSVHPKRGRIATYPMRKSIIREAYALINE